MTRAAIATAIVIVIVTWPGVTGRPGRTAPTSALERVVVVDVRGKPVSGLPAGRFRVWSDGVEVPIESVTPDTSPFTAIVLLDATVTVIATPGVWSLVPLVNSGEIASGLRNGFIAEYDDDEYILKNPRVRAGLTTAGAAWAFTSVGYAANWHPLTWLSHMADVELFGLEPRWHHLVSVLIHGANTALLFLLLRALTGRGLRSAFVAALFALHPLHVQSVAWAAERKDVLSTLFFFLTAGAYLRYLRRPGPLRYAALPAAYVLGLLAKPMLVSLPLVLLLLDFWPLGRLRATGAGGNRRRPPVAPLLLEKLPLALLAAGSAALTLVAQQRAGGVSTLEQLPFAARAGNAAVALLQYVGLMLWPAKLAVLYPHPGLNLPLWQAAGAALLVAGATAAAVLLARRFPWGLTGWAWYLVTLGPVIGIVQVGTQAVADRYTYVPLVGLFLAASWGAAGFAASRRIPRALLAAPALLLLALLAALTARETRHWENGVALFSRAVAVTRDNPVARVNLGNALARSGRKKEAAAQYAEALRLSPSYPEAHANLGRVLAETGQLPEALYHLRTYLWLNPAAGDRSFTLTLIRLVESRLPASQRGTP